MMIIAQNFQSLLIMNLIYAFGYLIYAFKMKEVT